MSKIEASDKIILEHLGFSMVAGAIPIPIVDVVAITAIQVEMLSKIAKVYEIDFNEERAKAIVSSASGTIIGLTIGRLGASAVKFIPIVGTFLGIGSQMILAGASTYAIGKVFQFHFEQRGNFFNFNWDLLRSKFEEFFKHGEEIAKSKEKTTNKEDVFETLAKLNELRKQGALTEEEYNKLKSELLAKI